MPRAYPIANHNRVRAANDAPTRDRVQPFLLEASQLRGRMVRLNDAAHTIISCHAYPEPVARLLTEALSMTALLAGMLKYDGVFTLQIKGDGPVTLVVCDLTTKGHLRGYASFDADAIAALPAQDTYTLTDLCGGGYLAFTVDQKKSTDRYQGIVALDGASIADAVRHYFRQSEQIKTGFEVAVGQNKNGHWQGAAIMLQQLALEGGIDGVVVETETVLDNWRGAMLLLNTASAAEMLDEHLAMNDVLYRLFHEDGVRVFTPLPIIAKCRCSRAKVAPVIEALPIEEQRELAENGKITVTCEFCNKHYHFPVEPEPGTPKSEQ